MKFAVTSRGDDVSNTLKQRIETYLLDFGLYLNEDEPDLVITVGGDGTLLQAFHDYSHRLEDTAFVGIHTGHLGFYADWMPEEVEKLVIHIAKTPYHVVEYPLLEVIIVSKGHKETRHLALNECTVKSIEGSLVSSVEIKGEAFEIFRGDGLCISTPSGSTAYNKALGGAILHPSLASIQIAEMASINNRVYRTVGSPLVLPQHHTCLLKPLNKVHVQVSIDHYNPIFEDIVSIQCRVADEKIRFARFRPFPFWKRVKESFIGE
ncbi:inorganic polyphosphate/ATP-NAD kinase [Alkalihalobacillus alcalophilus ATCC 27647 = CGMCC 1.3604]|uniref:NAD kinase n=1 Tax=Alkalihalobacillus alcalophilus ATCC 27647 = CGMCC 1.3604 TaxID=1218173 RepID=A0A094WKF4_ALKAL|nr:NAD kinase [Alkalihalobacillus alcalophilus]KGA97316.1 inorganic polyphosphate kinase [Alkalihalobacillus alcalophilus ATCC 27647 = CGMCC 1.3604]MED1562505.1 NAD kinase [Alkalihalobacillus alcalophilus]THG92156.1 inorganic polyphosphate/ATP-NAD kinase [Alkalihalobacillus alcalophilus ATCC 27647 = CGMCC 1.3604]